MFDKKQTSLFDNSKKQTSVPSATNLGNNSNSGFINAGLKQNAITKSDNGSVKYSTTGNDFVDQFGTIAQYKAPRSYADVSKDMDKLWSKSPLLAVMFTLYIRMVTRVVQYFNGEKTEEVQRGAGLKSEGIMRMIWIHTKSPDIFWKNITLFITVGSWKDVIEMLRIDLEFNGWNDRKLDWNKFRDLILSGLENNNTRQLLLKYIPQIKANASCTTLHSQANNIISKWICSIIYGCKMEDWSNYKQYRKLKTSGTAHQWQQLISKKQFNRIDFKSIHGRALQKLVSGKFLKNQGLEQAYATFIAGKPTAKFTGFVYELAMQVLGKVNHPQYEIDTINAQYQTLLDLAKVNVADSPYRAIGVLDSSGSMSSLMYEGSGKVGKMKSVDVATSHIILLDDMLESSIFKGYFLEFSNTCNMVKINGNNFYEKTRNKLRGQAAGTNFLSVIDLFIKLKNSNPHLAEKEFPNMIVCFSDGEFNSAPNQSTNIEAARRKLINAGFSKEYAESFGFCFVDMPNMFNINYASRKPKFETFGDTKNCFYFSGYDLSPLAFLFGGSKTSSSGVPSTAAELFDAAMDQEVLLKVQV